MKTAAEEREGVQGAMQDVAEKFLPTVEARLKKWGVAFTVPTDYKELGTSPKAMATIKKVIGERLGVEIESIKSTAGPERLLTLTDLLKMSDGTFTPEVKRLYQEQFEGESPSPALVAAARERLNIKVAKHKEHFNEVSEEVDGLKEMMATYRRYQRILEEIAACEEKLEVLNKEKELYKPAAEAIRVMREANQRIKEAARNRQT